MSKKINILFITTIPIEIKSGGAIYSKSIHNALKHIGNTETLTLEENQKIKSKVLRLLYSIICSIPKNTPPNILLHSGCINETATKKINKSWDLLVIDHIESSYVRVTAKIPVLYISHNIEHRMFESKIFNYPEIIKNFICKWIERYEIKYCKRANGIITISSEDAKWLKQKNSCVSVVPPSFSPKIAPLKNIDKRYLNIGFLGNSNWRPNRIALNNLIKDIIPKTNKKINLVIAGSGWTHNDVILPKQESKSADRPTVEIMGAVDDIVEFWQAIDVFVAPITSGEGVNVKVCESLAYGCPVIAFRHALRGLDDVPTDLVMIAENSEEFANLIDGANSRERNHPQPDILKPRFATGVLSKMIYEICRDE